MAVVMDADRLEAAQKQMRLRILARHHRRNRNAAHTGLRCKCGRKITPEMKRCPLCWAPLPNCIYRETL